jgi:hypothetical protein
VVEEVREEGGGAGVSECDPWVYVHRKQTRIWYVFTRGEGFHAKADQAHTLLYSRDIQMLSFASNDITRQSSHGVSAT